MQARIESTEYNKACDLIALSKQTVMEYLAEFKKNPSEMCFLKLIESLNTYKERCDLANIKFEKFIANNPQRDNNAELIQQHKIYYADGLIQIGLFFLRPDLVNYSFDGISSLATIAKDCFDEAYKTLNNIKTDAAENQRFIIQTASIFISYSQEIVNFILEQVTNLSSETIRKLDADLNKSNFRTASAKDQMLIKKRTRYFHVLYNHLASSRKSTKCVNGLRAGISKFNKFCDEEKYTIEIDKINLTFTFSALASLMNNVFIDHSIEYNTDFKNAIKCKLDMEDYTLQDLDELAVIIDSYKKFNLLKIYFSYLCGENALDNNAKGQFIDLNKDSVFKDIKQYEAQLEKKKKLPQDKSNKTSKNINNNNNYNLVQDSSSKSKKKNIKTNKKKSASLQNNNKASTDAKTIELSENILATSADKQNAESTPNKESVVQETAEIDIADSNTATSDIILMTTIKNANQAEEIKPAAALEAAQSSKNNDKKKKKNSKKSTKHHQQKNLQITLIEEPANQIASNTSNENAPIIATTSETEHSTQNSATSSAEMTQLTSATTKLNKKARAEQKRKLRQAAEITHLDVSNTQQAINLSLTPSIAMQNTPSISETAKEENLVENNAVVNNNATGNPSLFIFSCEACGISEENIKKFIPEVIFIIAQAFAEEKYKIYLYGGVTRDLRIGRRPNDFDLISSAYPNEALDLVRKLFNSKGINGNAKIINSKSPIVAIDILVGQQTIRVEIKPMHGKELIKVILDKASAKNNSNEIFLTLGRSLEENIESGAGFLSSDTTIGKLYFDLLKRQIIASNPEDAQDLKHKRLQMPLEFNKNTQGPLQLFIQDPSRLMRAIRFIAVYGNIYQFTIDPNIIEALRYRNLLEKIYEDKILLELQKMFTDENNVEIIKVMIHFNMFESLFKQTTLHAEMNNFQKYLLNAILEKVRFTSIEGIEAQKHMYTLILICALFTMPMQTSIDQIISNNKKYFEMYMLGDGIKNLFSEILLRVLFPENLYTHLGQNEAFIDSTVRMIKNGLNLYVVAPQQVQPLPYYSTQANQGPYFYAQQYNPEPYVQYSTQPGPYLAASHLPQQPQHQVPPNQFSNRNNFGFFAENSQAPKQKLTLNLQLSPEISQLTLNVQINPNQQNLTENFQANFAAQTSAVQNPVSQAGPQRRF